MGIFFLDRMRKKLTSGKKTVTDKRHMTTTKEGERQKTKFRGEVPKHFTHKSEGFRPELQQHPSFYRLIGG